MNILNKLTVKHLKMNKKRTIVSIIGIILSTALMVGVGLLSSTLREVLITDVKESRGEFHAKFVNVEPDKINLVKNNTNVDNIYYAADLGYSLVDNENIEDTTKPYYHIYGLEDNYLDKLNLIEGNMPKNSDEVVISNYMNANGMDLKVGDSITVKYGKRYFNDEEYTKTEYQDGEVLKESGDSKTYKIVGIIKKDVLESYSQAGYSIYTKFDNSKDNKLVVYVNYKKITKAKEITRTIANNLGFTPLDDEGYYFNEVSYNDSLLALYGVTSYDNMIKSMMSVLFVILGLVSIACVIVIYNSFAISVMERKKQFGLFSSIGATKKQIRKTVIFEAIVVSIIGIPLGILSSYIGIGVVIAIMNNLIGDMMGAKMVLCTYPIFLIIPIIFMLATIFISAIIPARRASKISPIEAIRLNDDIKIKGKKVKSPKYIRKIFGIEGDIAYKNIKRNKKKYRITIASLFISIVLFISFSGFMDYALRGSEDYLGSFDFDAIVTYQDKNNYVNSVINSEYIDYSADFTMIGLNTTDKFDSLYNKNFKQLLDDNDIGSENNLTVIILSDKEFNKYLKENNFKEEKAILYGHYQKIMYSTNSRKSYNMSKYNNKLKDKMSINISALIYDENKDIEGSNYEGDMVSLSTIEDYYISSKEIPGSALLDSYEHPIILLNNSLASKYSVKKYKEKVENYILIKTNNNDKYDKYVSGIEDHASEKDKENAYYENVTKEIKDTLNMIFIVKLLVYGFICLVTLIGITSVFNTINTSIALRRKEFAVFRSIGLTPGGFRKMMLCESIFFGLKSLIYALPVSIGVVALIAKSTEGMVSMDHLLIPWGSIIFSILGVFVVIAISMIYATHKIKDENILDAIREENI